MSDIIISGYYGLGNSGDEALLESIVKDLRSINPDITITALSGNVKLTEKLYGIKVLISSADIAAGSDNEAIVKSVVDAAIAEFGRIDVLINNAQASASGVTIQDHTIEQFDLALYSGLYATFYYMKACYPYLKETKGSIIKFASGAGLFGNYGQCAYAAAKEGIRGLSRVAATEWAKDGINTNIVCPLGFLYL